MATINEITKIVWGVGTPRTVRAHWSMHELGLDYEHGPIEKSVRVESLKIQRRSPPARGLCGDCFALRDLGEPRHHRCGIAVKDLRARILADRRLRKRFARPLAAEFGSVG